MDLNFVTFGDGSNRWKLAARRLHREARRSGWFSSTQVYDLGRLIHEAGADASGLQEYTRSSSRGFGYWLWKPILLKTLLSSLAPNSLLVYLDAGCQLNVNQNSKKRLEDYAHTAQENGIFAMETGLALKDWCKQDLLQRLRISDADASKFLVEPGVLFMANTPHAREFVSTWLDLCLESSNHFLDDSPSATANTPDFVEHRHDQSIFSCLYVARGIPSCPVETYFPNEWTTRGMTYPIWAARNSYPFKVVGPSLSARIVTKLRPLRGN